MVLLVVFPSCLVAMAGLLLQPTSEALVVLLVALLLCSLAMVGWAQARAIPRPGWAGCCRVVGALQDTLSFRELCHG